MVFISAEEGTLERTDFTFDGVISEEKDCPHTKKNVQAPRRVIAKKLKYFFLSWRIISHCFTE